MERRSEDGIIEFDIAIDISLEHPTPYIWVRQRDWQRRVRTFFYDKTVPLSIDHTVTCNLHIRRPDGQFSEVAPMPYEDGTNVLVYEFTEFFAQVPGICYFGVVFLDKEPDEKGVRGQLSTPNMILEVEYSSIPPYNPQEIL